MTLESHTNYEGFFMWVCLSNAFLSIIQPDTNPDVLRVRARRKGDIERVFPDAKVTRTPGRDYLYRAHVSRAEVQEAMVSQVAAIDYPNFKNSVKNDELHHAYGRFWSLHADLQEIPPYSRERK